MKYVCPLLAVADMDRSLRFYEQALGQEVVMNHSNQNVTFQSGFALQAGFAELVGLDPASVKWRAHNAELYFEEDDLDGFLSRVEKREDCRLVHGVKEYPWGQRVARLYDPDGHIIEVGESMEFVVARFLRQGMTEAEAAARSQFPLEFVRAVHAQIAE